MDVLAQSSEAYRNIDQACDIRSWAVQSAAESKMPVECSLLILQLIWTTRALFPAIVDGDCDLVKSPNI